MLRPSETPSTGPSCPWCDQTPGDDKAKPEALPKNLCPCGAVAFVANEEDYSQVIDAMIDHFAIAPSPVLYDVYERDSGWLRSFHIERKQRRGSECVVDEELWYWFKRRLPWDGPERPLSDDERLQWLSEQAEKFYQRLYESQALRADFREAKTAFKQAIRLASKLGQQDEVTRLTERLAHVTAVYEQLRT